MAFKDGIEQGISTGIKENRREVVIGMLKENLDISLISKITGLNIEDITKIKNENNM